MRFWKSRTVAETKVGIGVAAFLNKETQRLSHALQSLVSSLQAQTITPHMIQVTHDGPYTGPPLTLGVPFVSTKDHVGKFGHPHRQATIDTLMKAGCEWILLTNQDNWYAPVFLEWLLSDAQRQKMPLVYCDMVHSHKLWKPFTTQPRRGQVDLGGFLFHRTLAERVRFDKHTFDGDGDFFERLRQTAKGRVAKVAATLFVHN